MERSKRTQHFLDALTEKLTQAFPDQTTALGQDIDADAPGIRQTNPSRVVDEPPNNHLELSSLILARYRVLSRLTPDRFERPATFAASNDRRRFQLSKLSPNARC